ncbi:sensor histidine kinase [Clostridium sp. PL3]|uniref:histidine kinase n=1 Tax=Clostridium thailandense TaxID=2794346 RepID=A0A949X296_9CLOT|nr:sensor histidine kinase [Clostridium thailandense]MBV7272974.1 sensor histidine kinase [Clostridium thailandense]
MKIRKHRLLSMQKKLFALIFITLIPLTLLQIYNIRSSFVSSVNKELEASQDYCEAISKSFTNYVDKTWTNEYAIGMSIVSNKDWSQSDIDQYMRNVLSNDEDILSYTWTSSNGDVIANTNDNYKTNNLSNKDYVQEILNGKDKVVADLQVTSDGKHLSIPIARGIKVNNELKGIIITLINTNKLYKVFPDKRVHKLSNYGLIDKSGRIVYRSGSESLPFEKRLIPQTSIGWKALQGEIVKYDSRKSYYDDTKRMGVEYPIKAFGWSCYATSSVSEINEVYFKRIHSNVISLIFVYIISFLIAFTIGKRHIYSINKLKEASNEILNGNSNYKVAVNRIDEYGDVAFAFNQVTEDFNKKINKAEEYNNQKSQFLATISHELKTPLNIIFSCVQLVEREPTKDKSFIKYHKMIRQNSFRLLRLINNFIDINKIEVNNLTLNLINDNIIKVIEDITISVVEYTNLKKIELIFDTEVEEKYMAFDPDKVERIILNLLSNAIKFTDQGGSITVTVYDKVESIIVSVKDTGIGIPKEMHERVFERFVQVDGTLRRSAEGSGIGLSLVKSLVELHNGKISVFSELDKGSEFLIELPVRVIDSKAKNNTQKNLSNVDRIQIEFSDIYT